MKGSSQGPLLNEALGTFAEPLLENFTLRQLRSQASPTVGGKGNEREGQKRQLWGWGRRSVMEPGDRRTGH